MMLLLCLAATRSTQLPLRLRADHTFNIIQIADVHTGEGEASWGPGVDKRTYAALDLVLRAERNLDLAVFSGDMLTGLNVDANATAYWDRLVQVVDKVHLPHTAILGNHDAEPFSGSGANQSSPGAKTNRTALIEHDTGLLLSYSQLGPENLRPAVSVYVVDVFPHVKSAGEIPALQLFHLDSGGGGMPEELYTAQIKWFNHTIEARRKAHNNAKVPALVFVHIPLWEFESAIQGGSHCFGDHSDGITPTIDNTGTPVYTFYLGHNFTRSTLGLSGLFAALDAAPEVQAVFVGHDHCNDFCCQFGSRGIDLCFARHSGYGGYTCKGYEEGSRVITFHGDTGVLETHVRMNSNLSVVHQGVLV
jgi:hypothetical protein